MIKINFANPIRGKEGIMNHLRKFKENYPRLFRLLLVVAVPTVVLVGFVMAPLVMFVLALSFIILGLLGSMLNMLCGGLAHYIYTGVPDRSRYDCGCSMMGSVLEEVRKHHKRAPYPLEAGDKLHR